MMARLYRGAVKILTRTGLDSHGVLKVKRVGSSFLRVSDPKSEPFVIRARLPGASYQTHIRSPLYNSRTNILLATGLGLKRARPIWTSAVQAVSSHGRPLGSAGTDEIPVDCRIQLK